jgi:hypothetical protein
MTPDDIAKARKVIAETDRWDDECDIGALLDGWSATLDALEHAISTDGDHLSIASRRMVDTVMGERDALRAEVRRMQDAMHREVVLAEDRGQELLAERLRATAKVQIRGWK